MKGHLIRSKQSAQSFTTTGTTGRLKGAAASVEIHLGGGAQAHRRRRSLGNAPRRVNREEAGGDMSAQTPFSGGPGTHLVVSKAIRRFLAISGMLLGGFAAAHATGTDQAPIVVATSGDYPPFSLAAAQADAPPTGYGPSVIQAYAEERGREIEFVSFRWPSLLEALTQDRFDIAVGGLTVRPDRLLAGRFSVPVAQSGALVLVPKESRFRDLETLNKPDVRIAVNHGGHLERVTRSTFPKAQVVPVQANQDVVAYLKGGLAEAVVTDTVEAPLWQEKIPQTRRIGPFTQDRKAFLMPPDQKTLAADLDAWLLEQAQDGSLEDIRIRTLGPSQAQPEVGQPLTALLAAMDDRLSLMAAVAEAKRKTGTPIEVPEREREVLAAAIRNVETHDGTAAIGKISQERAQRRSALRRLFRAQIEAAKAVQLANGGTASPQNQPPDLKTVLRPALMRIGEQITLIVGTLPVDLEPQEVHQATAQALAHYALDEALIDALSQGIVAVARSNATAGHLAQPPQ